MSFVRIQSSRCTDFKFAAKGTPFCFCRFHTKCLNDLFKIVFLWCRKKTDLSTSMMIDDERIILFNRFELSFKTIFWIPCNAAESRQLKYFQINQFRQILKANSPLISYQQEKLRSVHKQYLKVYLVCEYYPRPSKILDCKLIASKRLDCSAMAIQCKCRRVPQCMEPP